eukprot:GCRY01001963.1.p1 GENE.GCRY01001963.1~~GCRY01001963.1.p1  ORF type:complete len:192 (-),score=13.20 GCRY01001963.1:257-832(-)
MPEKLKLVVVGDGAVGKTCLFSVFKSGKFPEDYVPTVFENCATDICVDSVDYQLTLWDTAGQEDYARLRPLSYPNSDVILICYAVNSPDSLDNVKDTWCPEVRHFCPNAPIILVCTKTDLRNDSESQEKLAKMGLRMVTQSQGQSVAKSIQAHKLIECSARNNDNVQHVFEEAVRAAKSGKGKKKKGCLLM